MIAREPTGRPKGLPATLISILSASTEIAVVAPSASRDWAFSVIVPIPARDNFVLGAGCTAMDCPATIRSVRVTLPLLEAFDASPVLDAVACTLVAVIAPPNALRP